ncbi:MAG: FISUMP domain-containing protein [Bacteroidota bacterium]|jgi:uncharacterized protein (TIGR02145 family)
MKKINLVVCFVLISFFVAAQTAKVVYDNNVNSTVTIETEIAQGSGFFVGPNLIATNYHVIEGATEAFCYTNISAAKYEIEGYVALDKEVDLVILKVKGLNKPAIKMATSTPTPGQKVYVLGSPKGLPATITDGIVSGLRDWDGTKLIQISAPISHGSSGGPVLNANGLLVGIAVGAFEDGQNLNFAIPKSNLDLLLGFKKSYATPLSSLAGGFENTTPKKPSGSTPTLKSVKIGDQVWSAENLYTDRFANGDLIPEIKNLESWVTAYKNHLPAWCYYNNDPENGAVYGKLYNQYAVSDTRGLCPIGWHVPSLDEWTILSDNLGGPQVAGAKMKEIGLLHWKAPNYAADDQSGFSGLPSGMRGSNDFKYIGEYGYWFSSTSNTMYSLYMYNLSYGSDSFGISTSLTADGISVRCIKD